MKIDRQILDLGELFLSFIFVQFFIFWIVLLPFAKNDYINTQQVSYAIKSYQAPSEMKLEKGQYKQGYLLKLIDQSSQKEVLNVDCTPFITDHIVAKFCLIFFNQTVKLLTVDLYERYNSPNMRLSSKIKSVTYKDLDNNVHKTVFWDAPYKIGVDRYKAKNKFILYTILNLGVLLLVLFLVCNQRYEIDGICNNKHLKYFIFLKLLFVFIIIVQIFAIFYYLFSNI